MSTGHRVRSSTTPAQLRQVDADPEISRFRDRYRSVDKSFDIPYVAGYSQDGLTIYIDRHLPKGFRWGARNIQVERYLLIHESLEKALMDAAKCGNKVAGDLGVRPGDLYYPAHNVALYAEETAVREDHGEPALKEYRAFFDKWIKADDREKIKLVPPDLDLTPYLGPENAHERALLKHLQGLMR